MRFYLFYRRTSYQFNNYYMIFLVGFHSVNIEYLECIGNKINLGMQDGYYIFPDFSEHTMP